mgnify:FL=1
MALRHSAFYSPLLMTMAGGFLAEQGLEYNYKVETPDCTVAESIRNGSCDLAQSAVAASFAALERGETPGFMHFAQINSKDGFFIAAREPDENFTWQKLIGKQVLVDHFFQPLAMFKYALHQQGISYQDLKVIDAGDVEAIDQAFRNGRGDYVHMQGPAPQQMQRDGIGSVVAVVGDAVGPVAFSSLCASPAWLESDLARTFMRAYTKALQHTINTPAAEIAARQIEAGFFTHIDPQVLTDTITAYQALGCWQAETEISLAVYEKLLEVFLFSGGISQRHAYDKVIMASPS